MSWHLFKYGFLLFIFACVAEARSTELCNPVVEPVKTETTIALLLTDLAEKYNFSLSFPKNLDQPVQVDTSMRLDRLIKMLTTGMNTVLRHEKVEGCSSLRLSELTVIPVGEETELINVEQKSKVPPLEYIYIENMEQYVTEVLMRERKANVKKMTPEQVVEFKSVKKRLKKELKDEIKQGKKKKKKQKQTDKNISKEGSEV